MKSYGISFIGSINNIGVNKYGVPYGAILSPFCYLHKENTQKILKKKETKNTTFKTYEIKC